MGRAVVAAFESLPTADAPPPRSGHTAVRLGSDVVVFGGHVGGECTAATVALDIATLSWRTLETDGPRPRPRLGHAACAASETEMWVIGGGDGKHKLLSDVHRLSVGAGRAAWSSPACTGAKLTGRMGHSLAHVPWRRALLCFGGFVKGVKGGYCTQVLLLALDALVWTEVTLTPQPFDAPAPAGRLGSALAVLPAERRILVLGGSARSASLDEVLLLDLEAGGALEATLVPLPAPPGGGASRARAHGAALLLPPYVLHLGGADGGATERMDVLHAPSGEWASVEAAADAGADDDDSFSAARRKFAGVVIETRREAGRVDASILVWGGEVEGAPAGAAAAELSSVQLLRVSAVDDAGGGGGAEELPPSPPPEMPPPTPPPPPPPREEAHAEAAAAARRAAAAAEAEEEEARARRRRERAAELASARREAEAAQAASEAVARHEARGHAAAAAAVAERQAAARRQRAALAEEELARREAEAAGRDSEETDRRRLGRRIAFGRGLPSGGDGRGTERRHTRPPSASPTSPGSARVAEAAEVEAAAASGGAAAAAWPAALESGLSELKLEILALRRAWAAASPTCAMESGPAASSPRAWAPIPPVAAPPPQQAPLPPRASAGADRSVQANFVDVELAQLRRAAADGAARAAEAERGARAMQQALLAKAAEASELTQRVRDAEARAAAAEERARAGEILLQRMRRSLGGA